MKDYVAIADKYAEDVVKEVIPACLYVRQACERYFRDKQRDDIRLDKEEAWRWCSFLERLPHVKGKWATKREVLTLSNWQIFITVNIFGWLWVSTGLRRFRDVYVEVPRKNGKTFWFAGIGVGMLTIDREHGAEVYCGATTELQAWEVFRPAKQMVERLPSLCKRFHLEPNAKSIINTNDLSRFVPIIGNPGDGASPSCGIADEFHEHKTSDLVDTLETGMGAREQPLLLHITTAGSDMGGPCYQKRIDVISILKGTVEDDRIFGVIYTIDEDDEWDTVDAQIKANPNYGISVLPDYLEGQLKQARRSPHKQASYKTKHLNQWVGAKAAWMNMLAFQACRKKDLKIEQFKSRPCYVGIDLASKIDIASMAILFPPVSSDDTYAAFFKHYLPEETITENDRYMGFHAGGWLTSTPGNVIDFAYIEDDLEALKSEYQISEVAYDPFQATQFATRMLENGFPMIEIGATVKNFSEPMKQLEAFILEKKIRFDMDAVILWMAGNVTAKEDLKSNIFPNKERPENKIDGIVALIMAVNRAVVNFEQIQVPSIRWT